MVARYTALLRLPTVVYYKIMTEWGGKLLFSHDTKHSKGTGISQRPNSLLSFECLSTDPKGRFVIAKIKLGDEDFFLSSVYAPCDSQQVVNDLCLHKIYVQILSIKQTRPDL